MKSKDGKDYLLSTATLDDGSEATGVGEFKEGEIVRSWFDEKYNKIKIAHLIQAGNIAVALLCLIGLIVLIIGSIILVQVVRETYAEGQVRTTGTVFKQEIKPLELKGSADHNIQPATNTIQLTTNKLREK